MLPHFATITAREQLGQHRLINELAWEVGFENDRTPDDNYNYPSDDN